MAATLSVIVPVRDGERHIADALTSLRANARADFEFIVVDDGSADATREIAESFKGDLPGLTVIGRDASSGVSAARNLGLAAASGTYVTYLDGDDWYAPGYLPQLVSAIERLGCDFVRVDHVRVTGTTREVRRAPEQRRGVVFPGRAGITGMGRLGMVDYPVPWAGVYRRSLADQGLLTFDPALATAEDRAWVWRLHLHAATYAVASLTGVFYRRGLKASLTQVGDERQLHFLDAYLGVIHDLDGDDPELVRKATHNLCALIAYHHKLRGRLRPDVAATFDTRATAALREVPPDALAVVLPTLGHAREKLLRRFLP